MNDQNMREQTSYM